MAREHADQLQAMIEHGDAWPLPQEVAVQQRINEWRAFAESDSATLKVLARWQENDNQHMPYVVDPLPERIKDAFADLIFGAELDIEAAEPENAQRNQLAPGAPRGPEPENPDQELLDDIIDETDLPSEVQAAAAQCVAEGEVWWRIYVDRDSFEHPCLEWHSRADVVPLFRGKKVLACAFVSAVDNLAPDAPPIRVGDDADPPGTRMWLEQQAAAAQVTSSDGAVYRYVEIQTGGLVRNLLYQGTRTSLGRNVPLATLEEFADLPDEWEHGITVETKAGRPVDLMLAGRVANGKAGRLGRSQYAGIKDLLYELNHLQSIGSRNAETSLQKRVMLSSEVVESMNPDDDPDATNTARRRRSVALPDSFMVPRDQMSDNAPMGVLEFSDTWAAALIAWKDTITDDALTRARVAPQLVGRHTEDAATGPALRARLLDSVLAADGKARSWDDALPKIMQAVQLVDALPEEAGGCGHEWRNPSEPPIVIRTSILPEDENEEAVRHATLVAAHLEAQRTAIERLNPEWGPERVDEEIALIDASAQAETQQKIEVAQATRPPVLNGLGVNAAGGNGAGA